MALYPDFFFTNSVTVVLQWGEGLIRNYQVTSADDGAQNYEGDPAPLSPSPLSS